jgi:hypothetical protein
MTITNWEISKPEFDLLVQVADRALAAFTHYPDDKRTLVMDLMACHANACALDFKSMLEGPLQDLSHDIYGIRKHINRDTGKLEDFFTPRYALANHVPEIALPGGVTVAGGTQEQHTILRMRGEFVAQYCKAKGWDIDKLSIQQVLEIRNQQAWKTPQEIS